MFIPRIARGHRPLVLLASLALSASASGCVLAGDGDEASEIEEAIEDHMAGEIAALGGDLELLQSYLCRRADASEGVYSLRSFDGRLCDASYVDGLDVVGGAALLICWEADTDEFRSSGCAENALEEYGLDAYDRDAVIAEMVRRIDEYASEAGGVQYDVAKLLLCAMPASLLGPAADAQALFCDG